MTLGPQFEQLSLAAMPAASPHRPTDNVPQPLTTQQEKKMRNRRRITGEGNPRGPMGGTETTDVRNFGLRRTTFPTMASFDPDVALPHDTHNFREHGRDAYINLVGKNAALMGQTKVDPARVEQIKADPASARDPRFPGPERVKAVEMPDGRQIVVQGTHRSAADASSGRLFTEARVVPVDRISDAPPLLNQARWLREATAAERVFDQDATAKYTSYAVLDQKRKKFLGETG